MNASAKRKVRLVHFGWDNPTIVSFSQTLEKLGASPLDGILMTHLIAKNTDAP